MSLSIALLGVKRNLIAMSLQHGGDLPEQDIMQVRPFDCCWGVMRHGANQCIGLVGVELGTCHQCRSEIRVGNLWITADDAHGEHVSLPGSEYDPILLPNCPEWPDNLLYRG